MAKLSKKELESIIERDMPGYQAVERATGLDAPRRKRRAADQSAPTIDSLRAKYLGSAESGSAADLFESDAAEGDSDDDDEIVAVTPKQATDPWDQSARPKVVVVSGKRKKIVGSQG